MSESWNPKYVSYAKSNGNTPEKQLEIDKAARPGGGCMIDFLSWMNSAIKKADGEDSSGVHDGRVFDHDAFTAWVEANAMNI